MHVAVAGPDVAVGVGDVGGERLDVGDGNGVGTGDPWLDDVPERHAPTARRPAMARILRKDAFIGRL
jgi:hypothetical protein